MAGHLPEIRAAIRAAGSTMARVSRMENCGDLDMRAEICHFLPGMRAGRRLSDLLLCSFVLFLSGTAVHIIKAV